MSASALTSDPAARASAEDSRYQRALVLTLAARGDPDVPAAGEAPQPPAALPESTVALKQDREHEATPDWLSLRRSWQDDGGGA